MKSKVNFLNKDGVKDRRVSTKYKENKDPRRIETIKSIDRRIKTIDVSSNSQEQMDNGINLDILVNNFSKYRLRRKWRGSRSKSKT